MDNNDSFGGSCAAGDGGGRTNAGAILGGWGRLGPGGTARVVLNAGNAPNDGDGGITSVSKAGTTFEACPTRSLPLPLGEASTTRFLPPPTGIPATFVLRGDWRTPFLGDLCGSDTISGAIGGGSITPGDGGRGFGVGGKCDSITSTCQARFSSRNLILST